MIEVTQPFELKNGKYIINLVYKTSKFEKLDIRAGQIPKISELSKLQGL